MAAARAAPPLSNAAPAYEPSRAELEQVLEDLTNWLPGAWDSFPQVYFERTVRAPKAGEHEHWHRVFARIEAPQIGTHVFYGQINVGGRSGAMMSRSQNLYNATIDEARGVVSVIGQGPADPEKYENLQDRPELWATVRQRDPSSVRCDFVSRRSGSQIVGVLEGRQPEARKYESGTCTYMAGGNKDIEFFADAEWVLGPGAGDALDRVHGDGVFAPPAVRREHAVPDLLRPQQPALDAGHPRAQPDPHRGGGSQCRALLSATPVRFS